MGNKVNFVGMCLQVNCIWDSCWYVDFKDYGDLLFEDLKIKDFVCKECKQVGISCVIIECLYKKCCVIIYVVCFGVIIGKKGVDIEQFCKKFVNLIESELYLNIVEVCKFELDVQLVGESIGQQLECCVLFCCVMKCVVQNVMCMGV